MPEFVPTEHPLLPIPTLEEAEAMGSEAWQELMTRREEIISREVNDPLHYGYEPFAWKVGWSLMGLPWVDKDEAECIRLALGFEKPRRILFCPGGNRGSKTTFAAKTVMKQLEYKDKARCWCFQQDSKNSVTMQQSELHNLLPPELRDKDIRTRGAYIKHTEQNGFTGESFILPNLSHCEFRNYEQDKKRIEGGEVDGVWGDEHMPADWLETLRSRVATRNGWILLTCTPTEGYSPLVRMFQDGAETMLTQTAYLLPKDGKEPVMDAAMNYRALEELVSV